MVQPLPQHTPLFEASIDGAATVVKLLNSILFPDKPTCLFRITPHSIKATTEQSKVMQATAILPKPLFSTYVMNSPGNEISLKIDLRNLIHCIGLFVKENQFEDQPFLGNELDVNFSLGFLLRDESHPLQVVVQSSGVETHCEIATLAATLGFEVFPDISIPNTVCSFNMDIDLLAEIWQMFDLNSEYIGVKVTRGSFTFLMQSVIGSTAIEIDANHEGVEQFQCSLQSGQIASSSYRLALMKRTLRPLTISSFVTLKTSSEGYLSIKYTVRIEDSDAFVEYVFRSRAEEANPGEGIDGSSGY